MPEEHKYDHVPTHEGEQQTGWLAARTGGRALWSPTDSTCFLQSLHQHRAALK